MNLRLTYSDVLCNVLCNAPGVRKTIRPNDFIQEKNGLAVILSLRFRMGLNQRPPD